MRTPDQRIPGQPDAVAWHPPAAVKHESRPAIVQSDPPRERPRRAVPVIDTERSPDGWPRRRGRSLAGRVLDAAERVRRIVQGVK
jgi:hypothetical protein